MILQDYDIINHELNKVNHWLCVNKLSLNPQKTKYIVFRNKNKIIENSIEVKLQNCLIEQVQNLNFLGITINQHLTWNDHIGVISNKILRSITILNRLKHYLPVYTLKVLYNSLILSQLTYGILAWGNTNTRLYKLQKSHLELLLMLGIMHILDQFLNHFSS